MNSKIKKILKTIEDNGFEAYIVGGYVRDFLLNIETSDVDICTNALPKDIMQIFDITVNHSYGSISIADGKYNYDITTYRSEEKYDKRKPLEVEYVDNLITDINRRDFTINSICMNASGTIIDLLNGKVDLEKKIIRVIGPTAKKLSEDPLRILRAIRFSVTLGFALDEEIIDFIKSNKELIRTLSYYRKQEEINRIISSKHAFEGLKVLKDFGLLEVLDIDYDDIVIVPDILGIWAQMNYSEEYPFIKSSKETIKKIRVILEIGKIDNHILFEHGLYISMVAGEILGYTREDISQMFSRLPIKSPKDLKINSKDIFTILEIEPSPRIKDINNDLLKQVLNHGLNNNYDDLKDYIIKKWK